MRRPKAKKAVQKPDALEVTPRLFKILVDGKSCHGGNLAWSLPKDGQPGEWHEVEGPLNICNHGLHLTDWVAEWWLPNCTAYIVEAEGVEGTCEDPSRRKVVVRRVRLLREATVDELAASGVFSAGHHEAKEARQFRAWWGSPAIKLTGNAVHVNRNKQKPVVFTGEGELRKSPVT